MKKKDILKAGAVCALSLLLVTGCGEKKDDTSSSNSNIESNSNVTSNQNQALTKEEALSIGRDLYKKAIASYPSPLSGSLEEKCTETSEDFTYDCTKLYNEIKTIYTENNDIYKMFTLKDGKYLYEAGGIGFSGKTTTTLSVKSNEADKIVYEVSTDIYNEPDNSKSNYKNEFIIVKENDTWKISSYKYVLGTSISDEIK